MSNYTAELRTIVNNDFDIFDFEYTRKPEAQAIVSDEALEQGFIDRFYFREVGFETLERFKHKLKVQWLESILIFDDLLIAYNGNINIKANMTSQAQNTNIVNDTPKSALDFGEESSHASSIVHNTQSSSGLAGLTEIEALELYHEKIKDIQTEFYNTFDNLFMQIF